MPKSDLESFVQQYGKVKRLAKRLHEGEVVQLRDIAAVLGKQAITDFKSEWQSETNYRQAFKSKPAVVVAYEAKLKLADMMYGRAEKLSGLRGNTSKAAQNAKIKNMYEKAEKYYETALELLAENYEQDASLGMYFDRNFDFIEGNEPAPDIESVPRAKTSRSIYNKYVQHSKAGDRTITPTLAEASKADIKAAIVKRALVEMATTYAALENTLAAVKTAKMAEDLANAAKMKRRQQVRSKLSGTREF